jgi:hypothetical protein
LREIESSSLRAMSALLGVSNMARSRNIKPGLFKNEVLGVADPIYTLAFEGLWLQSDREGRLEDRPMRIKAETFPYRDVDMDACLDWLKSEGFILRYVVAGKRYIQVINFRKHQNPHKNETESEIPPPEEIGSSTEIIGTPPEEIGSTRADSLLLIPDSLSPDVRGKPPKSDIGKGDPPGFLECWSAYPKREGGNSRNEAEKAYRARLRSGALPADLLAGVKRYAAFVKAKGQEGTAYVKQAATFFGTGEHWREPWEVAEPAVTPGKDAERDSIFAGVL